jgi:hypothetical protein
MTEQTVSPEPFYIRQSHEIKTDDERLVWFRECASEARAVGAHLCRFSSHSDDANMLLVEGWKEKYVQDQGNIRWQLT